MYLRKHKKEELDKKSLPRRKPGLPLEYLKSYCILFLGILLPSWYHISHYIFSLMSLISHIPYCEKLFESSVFDDPMVLHLGALPVYCALPCLGGLEGSLCFAGASWLTSQPSFYIFYMVQMAKHLKPSWDEDQLHSLLGARRSQEISVPLN